MAGILPLPARARASIGDGGDWECGEAICHEIRGGQDWSCRRRGLNRSRTVPEVWSVTEAWTHEVLGMAIGIVGGLLLIIGWFFRRLVQTLDLHLKECRDKAIHSAAAAQWMSDCMLVLGTKLGLELPKRS